MNVFSVVIIIKVQGKKVKKMIQEERQEVVKKTMYVSAVANFVTTADGAGLIRSVRGVEVDSCLRKYLSLNNEVFLQTLLVKLQNGSKERIVRAILDSGSHRSYILPEAARLVGYEAVGKQRIVHIVGFF